MTTTERLIKIEVTVRVSYNIYNKLLYNKYVT